MDVAVLRSTWITSEVSAAILTGMRIQFNDFELFCFDNSLLRSSEMFGLYVSVVHCLRASSALTASAPRDTWCSSLGTSITGCSGDLSIFWNRVNPRLEMMIVMVKKWFNSSNHSKYSENPIRKLILHEFWGIKPVSSLLIWNLQLSSSFLVDFVQLITNSSGICPSKRHQISGLIENKNKL